MVSDQGFIVNGVPYGDTLAPGQMDTYSTPIFGGMTYVFDVTTDSISTQLSYTVAGPSGTVETGVARNGTRISYTAPTDGVYSIGFQTASGYGSFNFTPNLYGIGYKYSGILTAGHTYGDTLYTAQVEGYTGFALAGDSFALTLSPDSIPLSYVIGTEHNPVSGTIQPGQTISYTAAEAGDVGLAIKDAATTPGHYYFTISNVTPEGSSSGSGVESGTSTTTPAPTTTTHVAVAAPPPPTFTGTDMTTGQALAGYGSSFADTTPDSLAISTSVSNAFIVSGYGNDILTASGGGTNVLDDTGGAVNFEIGSTAGKNAFFLDAGQTPVTWNTLANMHSGDFAVIYGIGPQNLIDTAQDGLGVTGYTGLTLETYQNSGASFVTLAGFSKADLSDGKLATAFGTDPSGKSFLLVAAA